MQKINEPLIKFYMSTLKTNFGWIRPISDGASLIRLDWNQTGWDEPDHPDSVSRETIFQLQAYFNNKLCKFTLPLAPAGKTDASQHWLNVMAKIPYATLITYAEFARIAGKPNAARTAGTACATNPIPIIYPCHRIIRTDGGLGNYGSGSNLPPTHSTNLARKAGLLHLESKGTTRLRRRQPDATYLTAPSK
ncbi:methylated-DNA--[protein]-cysteine S-methyltransferase [Candidatus Puniceispirillum sp.]|nr:methylated-DNA--[protein]-cysteine S-methyltransferase [Candidatus Puniceispirillum sp.]